MDVCHGIAWAGLFVSLAMMCLYFLTLGYACCLWLWLWFFGLLWKGSFGNWGSGIFRILWLGSSVRTRGSDVDPGGSTCNVILDTCWSNSSGARSVYECGSL